MDKVTSYTPMIEYSMKGFAFFSSITIELASGQTKYVYGKVGQIKDIIMEDRDVIAISVDSDIDVEVKLYEDTTITANGTPIEIYNNNRNLSDGTTFKMFSNPTISDNGTLLPRGNRLKGLKKETSNSSDRNPMILAKNKGYLTEIINNTAKTVEVRIYWSWWEEGDL
jgi:hypothetical protein